MPQLEHKGDRGAMSEYQYYEFQALDRRLTAAEMADLRTLSSRVALTATSAIFVYNFGDFRGDPEAVLAQYFDALLYIANWGTRRLMFRLPQAIVRREALEPYCVADAITLETHGSHLILDMQINKHEGEWIDTGEGRLTGLIPLRDAILAGDYRALYLAWLRACQLELDPGADAEEADEVEDGAAASADYDGAFLAASTPEPPVPPNLKHLDGVLQAFIEFFELDPHWVAVGAEASASLRGSDEPLAQWIGSLPEAECRRLLLRAAQGEPNIARVIRQELRERFGAEAPRAEGGVRRTAGELLALVQTRRRHAADEQRRQEARARMLRLEALAQREATAWEEVVASIEQRTTAGYVQAVSQLGELHELAEYRGEQATFQRRQTEIVEQFRRLSGFRSRLTAAGLLKV